MANSRHSHYEEDTVWAAFVSCPVFFSALIRYTCVWVCVCVSLCVCVKQSCRHRFVGLTSKVLNESVVTSSQFGTFALFLSFTPLAGACDEPRRGVPV